MMAYQVPTPRGGKSEKPSMVTTLAFCLFMAGLMAVSLWWGLTNLTPSEAERREGIRTHDSLAATYTYDGEVIRWYVFTDPDSSVQYLVNDRGGCTPRIDQYGNIVGVQTWSDYE